MPRAGNPVPQRNESSPVARTLPHPRLAILLERAKQEWEQTFDAMVDPLAIVEQDGTVVRANRAWAHAAGIDVRTVPGRRCYEALLGVSKPCSCCPARDLSSTLPQGREDAARRAIEVRSERTHRTFRVWAFELPAGDGKPRAVCHYHDVTDEKEMQRQLVQAEKMAAVGLLAGGVAHEINNPLAAILAYAQLLRRGVASDEQREVFVAEIEEAALRCKEIVEDLLALSRDSARSRTGHGDVVAAVRRSARLVGHLFRQPTWRLEVDVPDDLPRVPVPSDRLMSVFVNLLTNAHSAMPSGGRACIGARASADGSRVVVWVDDDGVGIEPGHLEHIFEPFFTTKPEGQGTGLGLSIAYAIVVHEAGGRIDVTSRPGQGTRFEVALPVASDNQRDTRGARA